jgi:PST family polysaccharide transporter
MTAVGKTSPVGEGADDNRQSPEPMRNTRSALRWSSVAVIGKQVFQLLCALLLARILGPASYGVISVAMIYVTLTSLLLDQGLSAALIQRPTLTPKGPGAVASVNLLAAAVLGVVTWAGAPLIAGFFGTPAATELLRLLGIGLVLKGVAIVPRSMLSRTLSFKSVSIADVTGAAVGAITGISAAIAGAGPLALIYQVFSSDLLVAVILLVAARGPVPNLRFGELGTLLPFSLRVFATNSIAYFSRNTDNILVGRFLGVTALSYYSMAYRVLVIPIQFIGQTVNRVMFPVFARQAADRDLVAANLLRATGLLALVTLPVMSGLACASPQLVLLVLGDKWLPTAPLLSVLAIAGARETIFYITPSLMKALGLASLNLRFEVISTAIQVVGIVVGLFFGVLGVAVGYMVAGFVLTPLILSIQHRITGVRVSAQLLSIWPYVHASAWAAAAYLAISLAHLAPILTLLIGGVSFVAVAIVVLLIAHRRRARRDLANLLSIVRPGKATTS